LFDIVRNIAFLVVGEEGDDFFDHWDIGEQVEGGVGVQF
jgi:hypothetical protein